MNNKLFCLIFGIILFSGIVLAANNSLISTNSSVTPFYTNATSNPINISLNNSQSQVVTFYVKSNGAVGSSYSFFGFVNSSIGGVVSAISEFFTITLGDLISPQISFVSPTPANGTSTSNTSVIINVSISEANLKNVSYSWNNTNYSVYDDGLVLMYSFDNRSSLGENGTYAVDSARGNNGTAHNGVVFNSSGKSNGGAYFDGSSGYIDAGNVSALNFHNGGFTVSAWINPKDLSGTKDIAGTYTDNNGGNKGWTFFVYNGHLEYYTNGFSSANTGLSTNTWYYATITVDSSGAYTFYLNGNADGSGSSTLPVSPEGSFKIGAHLTGSNGYFNGQIDEVRIYNRSLSAAEVSSLYNLTLNSNFVRLNSTDWNLQINESNLVVGNYNYSAIAYDLGGNTNSTGTRTLNIQALCQNNLTNVSTAWTNVSCLSTNLMNQTRNTTIYDANSCGNYTNTTIVEYQAIDYCQFDITPPVLILSNYSGYTNKSVSLQENATDNVNISYWKINDTTKFSINQTGFITNVTSLIVENYSLNVSVNDTSNNIASGIVNIEIKQVLDVLAPNITFITANNTQTTNSSILVEANVTDASQTMMYLNDSSLVGYWNGENGAKDNSVYHNDGTFYGNATNVSNGKFGSAYSFDGVNSYINLGTSPQFNFTGKNFSAILWVKMSTPLNQNLFGQSFSPGFAINTNNGKVRLQNYNSLSPLVNPDCLSLKYINDSIWHQVGFGFNGKSMLVYIDGLLDNSCNLSYSLITSNDLYIGLSYGNMGANSSNSSIDEVMIFNRSLSQSEISALYNATAQKFNSTINLVLGNNSVNLVAKDTSANVATKSINVENLISPSSCRNLLTPNSVYTMTSNIVDNSLTGDCMIISAQNVTLDCAGYSISSTQNYSGVYSNQNYTTIKNCNISMGGGNVTNIETIGIEFNGANNGLIVNNTARAENGDGIWLYSSLNNSLISNIGISNSSYGLAFSGASSNNILTNNIGISNSNAGVILSNSVNNNILNNNTGTSTSGCGIYIYASLNNTLTNNTGASNANQGIYLQSSSNNTLTSNTGRSNLLQGIYLLSSSNNNVLISNVGIANISASGIGVEGSSSNILISNNGTSNSGNGITISNSMNNTLISNNGTSNSSTGLMISYSNNNLLTNNTGISIGGGSGMGLSLSSNNTLTSNTGRSNSYHGIVIYYAENNTLNSNTGVSNTGVGVYLRGSNNYLVNTSAIGNLSGSFGFAFFDNASNNIIQDCVNISGDSFDVILLDSQGVGNDSSINLNNTFINCSYNLSKENVRAGSSLIRKWYYQAYVNNTAGVAISSANVSAYNVSGAQEFSNLITNTNGFTNRTIITEYVNFGGTRNYYSNYTLSATNGTSSSSHSYNVSLVQNNLNDYFTLGLEDVTAPSVIFVSQRPVDITSLNSIGGVNITYNISDAHLNTSTIAIYFKQNSTLRNAISFLNGSAVPEWETHNYLSNSSQTFLFNLGDNEIYPGSYNLEDDVIESQAHTQQQLIDDSSYVAIELLNITNSTQYNFFEIMSNSSAIQELYYCNSSYNFSSEVFPAPSTSNKCALFNVLPILSPYNNTESENSKHQVVPLVINTTTGMVGTVKITPTSYFLLRGNAVPVNFYTIPNISRVGAMKLTTNNGANWTNQAYTVDAHFHQFSGLSSVYYYVCANDSSNNQNCSSIRSDLFDLAGLAPTAPVVYSPANSSYSNISLIPINYTASQSPNNYPIHSYNISLADSNNNYIKTIQTNNGVSLNYTWNTTGTNSGNYSIGVTACDILNQCSVGYSHIFSLTEAELILPQIVFVFPTPVNGFSTINNSVAINLSITEDNLKNVSFNWNGTKTFCSIYSADVGNYSCTNYNDSSLVFAMNFDNSSDLSDLSLKGNSVTSNGTTWNSSGKFGGSITLNGKNNSLYRSNFNNLPSSYMTLSAWVRTSSNTTQDIITQGRSTTDANTEYVLSLDSFGRGYFWDYDSGYGYTATSSNSIDDGNWHLISFVKSSTSGYFYLDGVLDSSFSALKDCTYSSNDFVIGKDSRDNAFFFNGSLDEVRVYNRSLSEAEIQTVYNSNLAKLNSTAWTLQVNENNLSVGNYFYSSTACDLANNCNSTENRSLNILFLPDTTPPVLVLSNYTGYNNQSVALQFNATDNVNISSWNINDTSIFEINQSGYLTNSTSLIAGNYLLNVSVNDPSNNIASGISLITILQACVQNLTNSTPTDWVNQSSCRTSDTYVQNRSFVEYDSSSCGGFTNVTHYEYRDVTCNYCDPNVINSTPTDWTNISCLSGDIMNQSRNFTEYDSNYESCYLATLFPSDLWNSGNNITYTEYQTNESCNFELPEISGIAYVVTANKATVSWNTNENASSIVYYGIDKNTTSNSISSELILNHSLDITGLSASTLYYYNVSSCDSFGACVISNQSNFTTASVVTPIVTPSAGGAGGGAFVSPAEIKKEISGLNVSTDLIELPNVAVGVLTYKTISVENLGNSSISFSIDAGNLSNLIKFDENNYVLAPYETKDIEFVVVPEKEAGTYSGKITITSGNKQYEIPVIVTIKSEKSLFDIMLYISDDKKTISAGDKLTSQITLKQAGLVAKEDVTLNYEIKDFSGNTYIKESETVMVENQKQFIKEFQTQNLPVGEYVLNAQVVYSGGIAPSSTHFVVIEKPNVVSNYGLYGILVGAIFVVIILSYLIIRYKKAIDYTKSKEN